VAGETNDRRLNGWREWVRPPILLAILSPIAAFLMWDATSNLLVQSHDKVIGELLLSLKNESDQRMRNRDEMITLTERNTDAVAQLRQEVAVLNARYEIILSAMARRDPDAFRGVPVPVPPRQ